jgi:tetratricopeptide (TPR) repeat protein
MRPKLVMGPGEPDAQRTPPHGAYDIVRQLGTWAAASNRTWPVRSLDGSLYGRLMRGLSLLMALASFTSAAAPSAPDKQEQARALVRAAKEAFDAGSFASAVELLTQARAIAPTPATTYNLARALERQGELVRAVAAYRDYLAAAPATPDRGAVEATIADLERRTREAQRLRDLERAQPPSTSAVETPVVAPATPQPSPRIAVLPWVGAAAGAIAIATGVAFGVTASERHRSAVRLPGVEEAVAAQQAASSFAGLSNGFTIGGAVVLGASLLWALLAPLWGSGA